MKFYIKHNTLIVENKLLPFKGSIAINLFGIIFTRDISLLDGFAINHELVHSKQILECLILLYYPLYLLEWFVKLLFYKEKAYYNLSFERDARNYANRKPYGWVKRIIK